MRRAVLADYPTHGEAIWARFNVGRNDQLWYYRALTDIFKDRLRNPLAGELDRVVTQIEALAEASGGAAG